MLLAKGEQHCSPLHAFPKAPGRWVSRGSPAEKKYRCCGHATRMGPWALQGKMLMGHLIPQDLAVRKNSPALIWAATSPTTPEKHNSSLSPGGTETCQMASEHCLPALPWGTWCRQDRTVSPTSQSSLLPCVPPLQKCLPADQALPVKSITTKH